MSDKYNNFAELSAGELPGSYRIDFRNSHSEVIIAAAHGGSIEPGTSEITLALAGNSRSYYLFEGNKASNNRDLHITSSNFDEPECITLLSQSKGGSRYMAKEAPVK